MVHTLDDDIYHEVGWGGPEAMSTSPVISATQQTFSFSDSAYAILDKPLFD
jgi:hypothetical protein